MSLDTLKSVLEDLLLFFLWVVMYISVRRYVPVSTGVGKTRKVPDILELELRTDNCDLPDMGAGVKPGFSGRADCALNP